MMNYFIEDLNIFYATIYGGILIGIIFDINRSLKNNFKFINKISPLFDILFWITITFIVFLVINTVEKFQLRYYHFVALLVGFILYYNTLSKFVLKFNSLVIKFLKKLVKSIILNTILIVDSLYYIFVYSIHLLFDIMFYIPNKFFSIKPKKKNKEGV